MVTRYQGITSYQLIHTLNSRMVTRFQGITSYQHCHTLNSRMVTRYQGITSYPISHALNTSYSVINRLLLLFQMSSSLLPHSNSPLSLNLANPHIVQAVTAASHPPSALTRWISRINRYSSFSRRCQLLMNWRPIVSVTLFCSFSDKFTVA